MAKKSDKEGVSIFREAVLVLRLLSYSLNEVSLGLATASRLVRVIIGAIVGAPIVRRPLRLGCCGVNQAD